MLAGDRLKEAANINRSLMVLNQCMETLRKNQEREKGRKVSLYRSTLTRRASADLGHSTLQALIVPFRHSKLTELFQSFFVGDGRVVGPFTVSAARGLSLISKRSRRP